MNREPFPRSKLRVKPLPRLMDGYRAITLPPFGIWIDSEQVPIEGDEFCGVLKHESVHWEQWRRYGTLGYYVRYLVGWLRHGYENHPMEIEARERSGVR